MLDRDATALRAFIAAHDAIVVLSGAGVSTASGIPDYRDANGEWKHDQPMQFAEFRASDSARQRYWARSYVGWQRFRKASPNPAHRALAELEATGKLSLLITQNVDGLHSEAGSRKVIDLHGRLDKVRCIDCENTLARDEFQTMLLSANPGWSADVQRFKPDGDAELAARSHSDFRVPGCPQCGGVLKPDVVMFGETVPRAIVESAMTSLSESQALLVVGSSLMVWSGFRFARHASANGLPIAIVNQGKTRADDLAQLKVSADCGTVMNAALQVASA